MQTPQLTIHVDNYKYKHVDVSVPGQKRKEIDPTTDTQPAQLPFSEQTGAQLPVMSSQTPADYFHLFFTNDLLDHICDNTNR